MADLAGTPKSVWKTKKQHNDDPPPVAPRAIILSTVHNFLNFEMYDLLDPIILVHLVNKM